MSATQVSKCPFHAAQRLLSGNHLASANTETIAQTSTSKAIPHNRTPKLFQAARWALDPVGYIEKNFRRHGDVFRAPVGRHKSYCLLNDPKAIQYVLTHDSGKVFAAPGELNHLAAPLAGVNNIIGATGKSHQRRRKIVMPMLNHRRCLNDYSQVIEQVTRSTIERWQVGICFDVRVEMQEITLDVILQVVLGMKNDISEAAQQQRYQALARQLKSLMNLVATPISSLLLFMPWLRKDLGAWSPGGRLRRLKAEIETLLLAEIETRRASNQSEGTDALSLLLAAKDDAGNPLSNQDLCDELMLLLLAGFETTTIALTWAMYWIQRLPEVRQKLRSELQALPESDDFEQLLSLPYLSAVCNETLRINPGVMLTFARRVKAPVNIGGYQFAAGELVMGSIYSLHRREELYPEPHRFRPERFLERQFSPYEFMPFGGGVRRCIGFALAQCEMKVVLATILRHVDLSLESDHPIKQSRRGVISGPKSPIRMKLISRVTHTES